MTPLLIASLSAIVLGMLTFFAARVPQLADAGAIVFALGVIGCLIFGAWSKKDEST